MYDFNPFRAAVGDRSVIAKYDISYIFKSPQLYQSEYGKIILQQIFCLVFPKPEKFLGFHNFNSYVFMSHTETSQIFFFPQMANNRFVVFVIAHYLWCKHHVLQTDNIINIFKLPFSCYWSHIILKFSPLITGFPKSYPKFGKTNQPVIVSNVKSSMIWLKNHISDRILEIQAYNSNRVENFKIIHDTTFSYI